jgi:uncharacterized membrane protein (UPF0127 family)
MRFAIDAVFCDGDGIVVAIETLRPGAVSRLARRARYCVELAPGRAAECSIDVGTRLDLI